MKKYLSLFVSLLVFFGCFSNTAMAEEIGESASDEMEIETIGVEEIIINSTEVTSSGTTLSGSYASAEYSTGIAGYMYKISFDWVAEVKSGNYVFQNNKVQNAKFEFIRYDITIFNDWTYVNGTQKSFDWEIADSGQVFECTFEFEVEAIAKDTLIHRQFSKTGELKKNINDLL